MKKQRQLITTYQAFELGQIFNVYEFIEPNGEFVIEKRNAADIRDYSIKYSRQNLEGIVKKTDEGIKFCFEKLATSKNSEKIRYTNQLRHHVDTFIKNYLKKKNKDIDNEQTVDEIVEKLDRIITKFTQEHSEVDIKSILTELCLNENIQKDNILKKSLLLEIEKLSKESEKEGEEKE